MRAKFLKFASNTTLPCKVFCGPGAMIELSGTVVEIGPGSALFALEVSANGRIPAVGERVQLKVLLPVSDRGVTPKCLYCRATVERSTKLADGSQLVAISFRRANFKDYTDAAPEAPPKLASRWAM